MESVRVSRACIAVAMCVKMKCWNSSSDQIRSRQSRTDQKEWKKLIDFGPMAPSKGTLKTKGTPKKGSNFDTFRGRLADFQRGKMAH